MKTAHALALGGLALTFGAAVLSLDACGSKSPLVGEGGECFEATDCQEGLVCIPHANGKSTCDNNLMSITMTEIMEAGPVDSGIALADGAAEQDATTVPPIDSSTAPPMDSSTTPPVDANTPPPVDANTPVDANHPVDANTPVDANSPVDSGGSPVDAPAG